jgi:hypothetical protein
VLFRSFISFASEIGLSDKQIMAQVGHEKFDMTLHYTHLTNAMKRDTSKKLNTMDLQI